MSSRRKDSFASLPKFAAKLYDSMMQSEATRQQYREIAQDLATRIKQGNLLDVGTGPGYLLLEVHWLNPEIELFGLDISDAMLTQAAQNLGAVPADLRQGNIQATDYANGFFDIVTCSGSFYLWDEPVAGLVEIYRILKDGGTTYLYETHRDYDQSALQELISENVKRDKPVRKPFSPRFFMKQLQMTYEKDQIVEILEKSPFAKHYTISHMTIAGLPVWLRIELKKPA
jgi:ubiquinone/menaquinone biosynthesis C-methylase UbiE